jgi:hypothetical protein
MTPARVAFKTFFQCRPLWLWHTFGAAICIGALSKLFESSDDNGGGIFSIVVVPLWSGVVAASVFRDILSRPFSFGIPRHVPVWRRTLFTVGGVVAAFCALIVLLAPVGALGAKAVLVWDTFFLCLAVFMSGVLLTSSTPNTGFLPAMVTLLMVVSLNEGAAAHVRHSVERVLFASPVATTVTCAGVLIAAWKTLGSRGRARKVCGEAFFPLHDAWNSGRQAAYSTERKMKQMRRSPGALMKSLERFFLARMESHAGHATRRSLWGTLYMQIGKAAPARALNLFLLALLLAAASVALGFYHPKRLDPGISGANLALFLVCVLTAEYRINPHAALMLNVSRKNRFRSLLFSALAQWVIAAIVAAALTVVSITAGRFLGEVTVGGGTFTFIPIAPKAFFVFAPMLPFFFLGQVVFPKHHVIAMLVITIVGTIVFFSNAHNLLALPALGTFLLQVVCWLPFVAFIRHYCFYWDLKLDGQ